MDFPGFAGCVTDVSEKRTIRRGERCRIYPDPEQPSGFRRIGGACRLLWNVAVGMELFEDSEMMRKFPFSHDSYIQTGSDNEYPPPGFA